MVAAGHRLKVGGDSMIGWAAANLQPRIALDINREDGLTSVVRFNNPYLPDTRSELALPIISKQAVLGALTIQSTIEAAFDQDDITVLQSIASSLANAIENARLFAQIQTNLNEISILHRQYLRREWIQVLETQGPQEYCFNSGSDKRGLRVASSAGRNTRSSARSTDRDFNPRTRPNQANWIG